MLRTKIPVALCVCLTHACAGQTRPVASIIVNNAHPAAIHRIVPSQSMGAALDGLERGGTERVYTPTSIRKIRSVGFGPKTLRLRTELAIEAWHWNARGSWSDAVHSEGYWTSSTALTSPILKSYGYRLPRRGNTIDQANNDGYSRLADGDESTFWKSNPYLDKRFTGESNSVHPQWIAVDLGRPCTVNGIRLAWAEPYATDFRVEYSTHLSQNAIFDAGENIWKRFPNGSITHSNGGSQHIRLCDKPVQVRYVRVWLIASSHTAPAGSQDIRDRLGYAMREIYVGRFDTNDKLTDCIRHGQTTSTQSIIWTSSTDPWHRQKDIDLNTEQPAPDRLLSSGLLASGHNIVAAPALYDTPENTSALLQYLNQSHFPIDRVEFGEEPDGQNVSPEDFGALYLQMAQLVKRHNSGWVTGGPSLQTSVEGYQTWTDEAGNSSWLSRWVRYLKRRKRLDTLGFFSFEWFPFDNVFNPRSPERSSKMLRDTVHSFERDGVPRDIPWYITEYGYSSFAGQPDVDLPGALVNAGTVAEFLALGGSTAFCYGVEPNYLMSEKDSPGANGRESWGNLTLFLERDGGVYAPVPAYFAANMLLKDWLHADLSSADTAEIVPVRLAVDQNEPSIAAYALHRDGRWRLLILNYGHTEINADIRFERPTVSVDRLWRKMIQYDSSCYRWQAKRDAGRAELNLPPRRSNLRDPHHFTLTPYSITVLTD